MLTVSLDKLVFESIREFENIEISLSSGINVIQVRNGYGKSTTLEILRWMFTGHVPSDVGDFPTYVRGQDTSGHKETQVATARLFMTIESGGETHLWRLSMHFDEKQGKSWFETRSKAIGGDEDGWKLPAEFRSRFFDKPAFTELFMFDGETAQELSEIQDHDQIVNSIREVTGLRSIYQHVESEGYLDTDRREAFDQEGVKNLDSTYSNWVSWEADLTIHVVLKETEKAKLERDIKRLEGEIIKHKSSKSSIAKQTDSEKLLKEKEHHLRRARKELTELTQDLLVALGNPSNTPKLWNKVASFNENLIERKLPEGVGRIFFLDMLKADACICGRTMDKDSIAEIENRSEKYLDDQILTVVNSMQSEVADTVIGSDVQDLVEKIGDKQYEISGIDGDIAAITDDFDVDLQKKLRNIEKTIKIKEKNLRDYRDNLQEITETDPTIINQNGWDTIITKTNDEIAIQPARFEQCKNLFSLRKVKRELDSNLAKAGPLHQINLATNTIQQIFNEALSNVMSETHRILEEDTQEIFDKIPGKGGDKIIKLEDKGFRFYDTTDTSKPQQGINIGAALAAAYSFISAMTKLGSVQIPLVCDSPVTGMDPMTVEGWVQEVWPLFPQMVLIATPGERLSIEHGPEGIGNSSLYSDEVRRMTLHREEENEKGKPQKGKMIVNEDDKWFRAYGAGKAN